MTRLGRLVEDLQMAYVSDFSDVPIYSSEPTLDACACSDELGTLHAQLLSVLDSMVDSPELAQLTAEERRRLTSFRLTAHRVVTMAPDQLLRHLEAEWGSAQNGLMLLSVGPQVAQIMDQLLSLPDSDRHHFDSIVSFA